MEFKYIVDTISKETAKQDKIEWNEEEIKKFFSLLKSVQQVKTLSRKATEKDFGINDVYQEEKPKQKNNKIPKNINR